MWIRPYWFHILYYLPKFKTDFSEKCLALLKSAQTDEQNDRCIIVIISQAVQIL